MSAIVDPNDDNYAVVDGQLGVDPSFGPPITHAPTVADLDQLQRAKGIYMTGYTPGTTQQPEEDAS